MLTIDGIEVRINGNFRPKALLINPKKMLPTKPPMHINEAIHEASSMEIRPDSKGESLDVSKATLGLLHPPHIPCVIINKSTEMFGFYRVYVNEINEIIRYNDTCQY